MSWTFFSVGIIFTLISLCFLTETIPVNLIEAWLMISYPFRMLFIPLNLWSWFWATLEMKGSLFSKPICMPYRSSFFPVSNFTSRVLSPREQSALHFQPALSLCPHSLSYWKNKNIVLLFLNVKVIHAHVIQFENTWKQKKIKTCCNLASQDQMPWFFVPLKNVVGTFDATHLC